MLGNFHTELGKDDVLAGALYDCDVHVFSFGGLGDKNDGLGVAMTAWVRETYPDFQPKRILDDYFDLVVSMLVAHECSVPVIKGLFREAYCLLAPGGMTIHDGEADPFDDPFESLMTSWFGINAHEPFSVGFKALDFESAFVEAGSEPASFFRRSRDPVYLKGQLPPISLVGAKKHTTQD